MGEQNSEEMKNEVMDLISRLTKDMKSDEAREFLEYVIDEIEMFSNGITDV